MRGIASISKALEGNVCWRGRRFWHLAHDCIIVPLHLPACLHNPPGDISAQVSHLVQQLSRKFVESCQWRSLAVQEGALGLNYYLSTEFPGHLQSSKPNKVHGHIEY